MPTTTPETQFKTAFETLYRLCEENQWGDPFSYARSREIHIATTLGHTVASTYSGADAFDQDGNPVEFGDVTEKDIAILLNLSLNFFKKKTLSTSHGEANHCILIFLQ